MKIAWILNGTVSRAGTLYSGTESQSGGWINDTFNQFAEKIVGGTVDLHIVVPVPRYKEPIKDTLGGTYYFLEWQSKRMGARPSHKDCKAIDDVLDRIAPDCIMLWGSEFSTTLCASRYGKKHKIPLLLYVQGLVNSFEGKFNGNLPLKEMGSIISPLDRLKMIQSIKYFDNLMRQRKYENEIFKSLYGVISDSEWCFSYARKINPTVKCFKHFLPVNEVFLNGEWSFEKSHKNEIFTIAGRTAYKGLHNLIKALPAVKTQFPDVRVYIPGYMGYGFPKIIKRPPYIAYLNALIKKCGVSENVVFLGKLNAEKMREQMEKCACFVMPSMVENCSTTLREAMFVGAPCVASLVGSVGEYVKHGISGSVYEAGDYEALSREIIHVLSNTEYAKTIANGSKREIRKIYSDTDYPSVYEIYREVCDTQLGL